MTEKLKELLTVLTVANVIKLAVGAVAVVVFYFVAEMTQNDRLATNVEAVKGLQETTTKAFEKFDTTLTEQRSHDTAARKEQRTFNTEMVKSMARMGEIQQQLKKENGRLADHAQESTKAIVRLTTTQEQLVKTVEELRRVP